MMTRSDAVRDRAARRFVHLSAVALAAALFQACGQPDADPDGMAVNPDAVMDTTPAGTPAPPSREVIADDQSRLVSAELREWAVRLSRDTVQAGQITFEAMNTGTHDHMLEVEGEGIEAETDVIEPGGTATLTVDLQPGRYEVYCPVEDERDHQDEGMTTWLVVVPADRAPPVVQ